MKKLVFPLLIGFFASVVIIFILFFSAGNTEFIYVDF